MSNSWMTELSTQKVNDARRVHRARQSRNQRLATRLKNLQARLEPPAMISSVPTSANGADLPVIHPALGRFAENWVPNLYWDLSTSDNWVYKRPISEEEMERSPFFPEQDRMVLTLCIEHNWIVTIEPRTGYRFITLRCFQLALRTCMLQPVSRAIWDSAHFPRKYHIAMAFFRRTGNLPAIPCIDVFTEWKKYLMYYAADEEVRTRIVNQMTEYVTRGAKRSTLLQTIDLLGQHCMFGGLMYLNEPNLWALVTASRHIASMAHHLLPRPGLPHNGAPTQADGSRVMHCN